MSCKGKHTHYPITNTVTLSHTNPTVYNGIRRHRDSATVLSSDNADNIFECLLQAYAVK